MAKSKKEIMKKAVKAGTDESAAHEKAEKEEKISDKYKNLKK